MQCKSKTPSLRSHKFLSPPLRSVTLNLLKARSLRRKNCASPQGFRRILIPFLQRLHFVIAVYETSSQTLCKSMLKNESEWMEWLFREVMYAQKMRLLQTAESNAGAMEDPLPSLQCRGYQTTCNQLRPFSCPQSKLHICTLKGLHHLLSKVCPARVGTRVRSLHGCQRQVWWTKGRVFLCCPTFMRGFGVSRGRVRSAYQIWWHYAIKTSYFYRYPRLQWHSLNTVILLGRIYLATVTKHEYSDTFAWPQSCHCRWEIIFHPFTLVSRCPCTL